MSRDPTELLTEELAPRLGTYELQRFRVVVTAGPDEGLSRASDRSELSIGTAEGNSLVLGDTAVSRHHCTITVTDRGFLLRDLDSTNGTVLAGFRVEAAYLEPGAIINAGLTTL